MYTTHLKKVGGSVMLALPAAILSLLELEVDMPVGITVEDGKLVIAPHLIAQCDPNAPLPPVDRDWLDAPAVGGEVL
jgi:antitoxin ChpS